MRSTTMSSLSLVSFGLLAAGLSAQASSLPHVVLTELSGGNPAAQLVEVDPVSGAITALPRFPSDTMPPLAVVFDAVDGATLVALDQGGGQSRIVRLDRIGAVFAEHHVATLTGRVAQLLVAGGDLVAAVDAPGGGLYRMPRRGGPATQVLQQDNVTAAHNHFSAGSSVQVAWTGRAGTPVTSSGTGLYDIGAQQWIIGPHSFANPNALEITGVIDMVTAVPRQLLSFSDGSFAMIAGLIGPGLQPVPTSPPIPAGGAVAMHAVTPYSVAAGGLGGSVHPFVYDLDPFSGTVVPISVALPGEPVDFAFGVSLGAHIEYFGSECGAVSLSQWSSGFPQLGSSFTVGVTGPASTPVFLAGGLDDFAAGAFPAVLPGGCLLEASPDVALFAFTAANGTASHAFNLPAAPVWAGTVLFFQWVHFDVSGLSTSNAAAFWVGS